MVLFHSGAHRRQDDNFSTGDTTHNESVSSSLSSAYSSDEAESSLFDLPTNKSRLTLLITAFEGWGDAGEVSTEVLKQLEDQFQATQLSSIDAEEYYDFQFTRPQFKRDTSGKEHIVWPHTRFSYASLKNAPLDIIFVTGVEPSYHWKSFMAEIKEQVDDFDPDYVIILGSFLSDVPHTRSLPVHLSSSTATIRQRLKLDRPQYEGPVGIVSFLGHLTSQAEIPTINLWSSVPHYVSQSPSPKAKLALMDKLEELFGIALDKGNLVEKSHSWEEAVSELAVDDPDVAAYVSELEKSKDTQDLPEASGDSIAREFEKYLNESNDRDDRF